MHWSDELPTGFEAGRTSTVELEVNPDTDRASLLVLASRISGIYNACRHGRQGWDGEDVEDLLRLADHLHRVLGSLTAIEDDLLVALRERGVSSHRLAAALDTNHRYVLRREHRIQQAAEQGLNSSGLDEEDH